MKRPLALTAYLLSTISMAIYVLLYLIGTIKIFTWADGFNFSIIFILLITAIFGVTLALNAASISTFKASPEKYKKKKATAVTAIVFNFITVLLLFISLVAMSSSVGAFLIFPIVALILNDAFIAIVVIVLVCVLAASILAIVDLCLENKRVAPAQPAAQPATAPAATDDLQAQLEKLTAMKENGTISDEEYQKLRQSVIEKAAK